MMHAESAVAALHRIEVGCWAAQKWRARRRAIGVRRTAMLMRKQGVPLRIALLMLGIEPSRP